MVGVFGGGNITASVRAVRPEKKTYKRIQKSQKCAAPSWVCNHWSGGDGSSVVHILVLVDRDLTESQKCHVYKIKQHGPSTNARARYNSNTHPNALNKL